MRNHIALILSYIREEPKTYARVIALSVAIGFLEFLGLSSVLPAVAIILGEPAVLPSQVMRLLEGVSPIWIVVGYLGVVLAEAGLGILNDGLFLRAMVDWRTRLGVGYVDSALRADFEHVSKISPGEMETILARNLGYAIRIRYRVCVTVTDTILSLCYLLIALYVAYQSLVLFVMLGVVYALFNRYTVHRKMRASHRAQERYLEAAGYVGEYLADVRGLLISRREPFLARLSEILRQAARSEKRYMQIDVVAKLIQSPIMLILVGLGAFFSRIVFGLPVSRVLVILFVFYRSAPRIIAMAKGYLDIIGDSPLDVGPEVQKWVDRTSTNTQARRVESLVPGPGAGISVRDVSVSHSDKTILSSVNLEVPDRSLVVLVGRSGTGKSTLLDLLCGFKRPDSGTVTIGGIDSRRIDYETWLSTSVGVVRAESVIVSGSIRDNIAYLEDTVEAAEVERLIDLMGLRAFLDGQGQHRGVFVRGENLSAGQRQRIVIARALYKRPKLLLLDEPTSNLDRKTEEDVLDVLARLKGTMTIVAASHRGSILALADRIYEVDNQTVVRVDTEQTTILT